MGTTQRLQESVDSCHRTFFLAGKAGGTPVTDRPHPPKASSVPPPDRAHRPRFSAPFSFFPNQPTATKPLPKPRTAKEVAVGGIKPGPRK